MFMICAPPSLLLYLWDSRVMNDDRAFRSFIKMSSVSVCAITLRPFNLCSVNVSAVAVHIF